eukprot:scaffold76006_cov32-Prasinocladus_malaysianus.AAC.1
MYRYIEEIARMPDSANPPFRPLDNDESRYDDDDDEIDYDFLSRNELGKLNRRVRHAVENWERTVANYLRVALDFVRLADILHNMCVPLYFIQPRCIAEGAHETHMPPNRETRWPVYIFISDKADTGSKEMHAAIPP